MHLVKHFVKTCFCPIAYVPTLLQCPIWCSRHLHEPRLPKQQQSPKLNQISAKNLLVSCSGGHHVVAVVASPWSVHIPCYRTKLREPAPPHPHPKKFGRHWRRDISIIAKTCPKLTFKFATKFATILRTLPLMTKRKIGNFCASLPRNLRQICATPPSQTPPPRDF